MDEATPMKPKKAAEEGHVSKLTVLMVVFCGFSVIRAVYQLERAGQSRERERTEMMHKRERGFVFAAKKKKKRGSAEYQ